MRPAEGPSLLHSEETVGGDFDSPPTVIAQIYYACRWQVDLDIACGEYLHTYTGELAADTLSPPPWDWLKRPLNYSYWHMESWKEGTVQLGVSKQPRWDTDRGIWGPNVYLSIVGHNGPYDLDDPYPWSLVGGAYEGQGDPSALVFTIHGLRIAMRQRANFDASGYVTLTPIEWLSPPD